MAVLGDQHRLRAASVRQADWRRLTSGAIAAPVAWLAVFVPLAILYLLTIKTDWFDMSPDPVAVTPSAWWLAHHGSPVLPAQLWPNNPWSITRLHGTVVSDRTPGLILLGALAYLLDPRAAISDYTPASVLAALIAAAAVASLGLLLRRVVSPRAALAGALVAGLATTTWTVSASALWPHGPDQLFLVLAMFALASGAAAPAGLAFAAAVLIRPPLAVVAAITACTQGWRQRSIRPVLCIGAITGAAGLAYLAYAYHFWQHGLAPDAAKLRSSATLHGYDGSFLSLTPIAVWKLFVKVVGTLVAPARGVLTGSPFLLALLPGLRAGWRAAPSWARSCAVSSCIYLLAELKSEVFSGGANFWSYRYPLATLTLCAPLFALSWEHWVAKSPRRRAVFAALVVFSVALQIVGTQANHWTYALDPWRFTGPAETVSGSLTAVIAFLGGGLLSAVTYLYVAREA